MLLSGPDHVALSVEATPFVVFASCRSFFLFWLHPPFNLLLLWFFVSSVALLLKMGFCVNNVSVQFNHTFDYPLSLGVNRVTNPASMIHGPRSLSGFEYIKSQNCDARSNNIKMQRPQFVFTKQALLSSSSSTKRDEPVARAVRATHAPCTDGGKKLCHIQVMFDNIASWHHQYILSGPALDSLSRSRLPSTSPARRRSPPTTQATCCLAT